MAATLVGTTPAWGIPNDEAGLIIQSLDLDYVNKEKPALSRSGETVGWSFYDEMVNISVKGQIPLVTPWSGKLAGTLALSNTIPNHLQGGVDAGRVIIKSGIKRGLAVEDFQTIEIPAVLCPLIS